MLQLFASLGVTVNGELLQMQAGVTIEDHVGRPCRVTIESMVPENGPEFDARTRLGQRTRVLVHLVTRGSGGLQVGPTLVQVDGPIVASRIERPASGDGGTAVRAIFTVEHALPASDSQ